MNIILFDYLQTWQSLLPITFAKPIGAIRVGILTIKEKWEYYLPHAHVSFQTQDYLQEKFPLNHLDDNWYINGAVCPNIELAQEITALRSNQKLMSGETMIAARGNALSSDAKEALALKTPILMLQYPWDIFVINGLELRSDFALVTKGRVSQSIDDIHTKVYGLENIFIEEGASIKAAILNAEEGPIYIGKNTQIHEGAIVKGACSLGEESHLNMGSKLRGDNTIGPHCKVGGEVSNSVFQGYSSKGHDGFMGNSVIGEWCNLGADTNISNLKNNYSEVEVYNYLEEKPIKTGRQFCGLIMGDHSKAGINTMFNTGSVVGFCANIFGAGFPPKFVPSFTWCDNDNISSSYQLDKALDTAQRVYARRNKELTEIDKKIFINIYHNK